MLIACFSDSENKLSSVKYDFVDLAVSTIVNH